MTATVRATELYAWAAWATHRASRPKLGDVATPSDLRSFAADCRLRARALEGEKR
jgi:hypothetical protein